MQYALLVYEDERAYGPDKNGPALQEMFMKHLAFREEMGARRLGGAGLKGTGAATTIRTVGSEKTVHDGPYAEAREQLGGFYLVDVTDLDEAIALAKRLPVLPGGAVEIRPLLTPPPGVAA